jgi:SAM-dependent methyltransferase
VTSTLVASLIACKQESSRSPDKQPVASPSQAAPPAPAPAPKPADTKAAFDGIYKNAVWGRNEEGAGNSGTGSTLQSTAGYRDYLQKFLAEHQIKSVVDAGCGDWEFSKAIDWTGIDYKGFDIVDDVIAQDTQRYAKPNIQFAVANIVKDDLPPADLLICKHVLQHLPTKDVQEFLQKQLPKFKYALITNGIDQHTLKQGNYEHDIEPGGYRALDITKPPFNIKGARVHAWGDGHHAHMVILVTRDEPAPKP